jgi:hypothetical protein
LPVGQFLKRSYGPMESGRGSVGCGR